MASLTPFTAANGGVVCSAFLTVFIASGFGINGGEFLVPLYSLVLTRSPIQPLTLIVSKYALYTKSNRPLVNWDVIRMMESLTRRPSAVSINSVNSAKVGLFMGEDAESGVVHRSRVNSVYIEQSSRGDVDVGIVSPVDDKRSVNGSRSPNIESSAQMSFSNIEGKKEQPSLVNMPPTTSVSLPKPPPIGEPKFQITNKVIHNEVMETHSDELEKILREEMQLPPWSKVRGLFAVFLTVLAFLALSFATRCGTSGFWLLIIVNALILVCKPNIAKFDLHCKDRNIYKVFSSIYNRATLLLQHQRKKKARSLMRRYTFAIGDIRWTGRSTLFNTILNGFAGFFSGLFGIGGAVVTYPLMMEMRALPEVALATSNTMVFFTTGVVLLSYASVGKS
eukprot:jgi/Bigna1/144028/aug1.83_g18736